MGHTITFFPMIWPDFEWSDARRTLPATIEVVRGEGVLGLRRFLEQRRGDFDRIIVSRPNNLTALRVRWPGSWPPPGLVYDAEAVFAERELQAEKLAGRVAGEE